MYQDLNGYIFHYKCCNDAMLLVLCHYPNG